VHPDDLQLSVSEKSGNYSVPEVNNYGEIMSILVAVAAAFTRATASAGVSVS